MGEARIPPHRQNQRPLRIGELRQACTDAAAAAAARTAGVAAAPAEKLETSVAIAANASMPQESTPSQPVSLTQTLARELVLACARAQRRGLREREVRPLQILASIWPALEQELQQAVEHSPQWSVVSISPAS